MIADDSYMCGEGHSLYEKSCYTMVYTISEIKNIIY